MLKIVTDLEQEDPNKIDQIENEKRNPTRYKERNSLVKVGLIQTRYLCTDWSGRRRSIHYQTAISICLIGLSFSGWRMTKRVSLHPFLFFQLIAILLLLVIAYK